MHPHQERVVTEKFELDQKLIKLTKFLDSELFTSLAAAERDRLRRQRDAMQVYSDILGERIIAFQK
jgi:hypothetical protein